MVCELPVSQIESYLVNRYLVQDCSTIVQYLLSIVLRTYPVNLIAQSTGHLKELESENAKLKNLLAESILDTEALKVTMEANAISPHEKSVAVHVMTEQAKFSQHRACQLVGLSRTALHYAPRKQSENEQLQARLIELTGERRRFGNRRLHTLVRR